MRILVTGGCGYIGAVLLKTMIAAGHTVRCLDRHKLAFENSLDFHGDQHARCEILVGDIRERGDLQVALEGADAVVNLAAIVGSPACAAWPEDARSINVEGARLLARVAPPHVPMIHMSTCSVYGRTKERICREDVQPHPITLYGETKLQSEEAVLARGGVVLRAVTAYGPSPNPRFDLLLHTLIRFGLTKRRLRLFEPFAVRPMIHIEDIARGLLFSLERFEAMSGKIYNLASDDGALTKMDLVTRVSELTGLQVEIDEERTDPDGRDYSIACCQIKKLGFKTNKPLDVGLRETTEWLNQIISRDS
jgi:nucleoside-diphosphate-sugar epimerase